MNELTVRDGLALIADEPRRPASSYSDAELLRVAESGLLRGGLVALEETLRQKDETIARMREFNERLAFQLQQTQQVATQRQGRINELDAYAQELERRIAELVQAGWDVLPTLELYWRGERPIPEWHPTGALRAVLEENA